MTLNSPVKVLLVDDSAVCRGFILRLFEKDAQIDVHAVATNGKEALEKIKRQDFDVVILDVEMPVMNGLQAIPEIQKEKPDLPIIMASALTGPGAQASLEALELGASDCVLKPSTTSVVKDFQSIQGELTRKVLQLGQRYKTEKGRKSTTQAPPPKALPKASPRENSKTSTPHVLAIGASTGGPNALVEFFASLGKDFPLPVLVTQHMPPLFTQILAERLEKASLIQAAEAEDGEVIKPGKIYVAPGDIHMLVKKSGGKEVISLEKSPPENFCRPAVDPLFRSVGDCYKSNAIACVFTGMGEDGKSGAEYLSKKGVPIYVQDRESSVIWGMPGAIASAGLATEILPPIELARLIRKIVKGGSQK